MGIYVKGVNMPKQDELLQVRIYGDGKVSRVYDIECQQIGTAIETTQVVPIEEVWTNVQPLKDKILELEEKLYLQNEIVRRKDCRHGRYDDDTEYYTCKHPKGLHEELYGVDFCPYGKLDMTRDEATSLLYQYKYFFEHRRKRNKYDEQFAKALGIAIKSLLVDSEWTPCSERLPYEHICDDGYVEPSEKVLVCTDSGTILTSRFWGNRQSKAEEPDTYADWVDIDWWHNVIAWMPLPKPYREGGNGE